MEIEGSKVKAKNGRRGLFLKKPPAFFEKAAGFF
jgi:hypothetical protein